MQLAKNFVWINISNIHIGHCIFGTHNFIANMYTRYLIDTIEQKYFMNKYIKFVYNVLHFFGQKY